MKQNAPHRFFLIGLLCTLALLVNGCARGPRHVDVGPHPMIEQPAVAGFYITVSRGQTLYRIAKDYGVDLNELMRVNRLRDSQLATGQRIFIPRPAPAVVSIAPVRTGQGMTVDQVSRLVGPKRTSSRWQVITVHHSGTLEGSGKLFHRDHIRRHLGGGGGLFYHFVIGNGTFTKDGEIETGWRWNRQVKAIRAHDIQICLVGDFDRQQVSEAQLGSLVSLITVLRTQYGIPVSRVRGHRDIPGKHTDCPGNHFPYQKLMARLYAASSGRSFG